MTQANHTQEQQYQIMLEYRKQRGLETLGLMTSQAWFDVPNRLPFTFARFKFAANTFSGRKNGMTVGCSNSFATFP